jgi:aspartyl/asparaginyl beta-hydroxylase (cupin superfamily)
MANQLIPERFVNYMSGLATGDIDPVMGTYPGIENAHWFDPGKFPMCAELEANFGVIEDEIRSIPQEMFFPDSEGDAIPRDGDWRILPVFAMGEIHQTAAHLLPTVVEIVRKLDGITTLGGVVFVSRLPAGASVGSHVGPTNTRARCHLGVHIPTGDCGIEVAGERRSWIQGRCLMLNDHLEHRVWNYTDQERIVLVLDTWHPDLTVAERRMLAGLQTYAQVQAGAISKWQADFFRVRETAPAGG